MRLSGEEEKQKKKRKKGKKEKKKKKKKKKKKEIYSVAVINLNWLRFATTLSSTCSETQN